MIRVAKPTDCKSVKKPTWFEWHEACLPKPRRRPVTKVAHYYLSVNAMTQPMMVREDKASYGEDG